MNDPRSIPALFDVTIAKENRVIPNALGFFTPMTGHIWADESSTDFIDWVWIHELAHLVDRVMDVRRGSYIHFRRKKRRSADWDYDEYDTREYVAFWASRHVCNKLNIAPDSRAKGWWNRFLGGQTRIIDDRHKQRAKNVAACLIDLLTQRPEQIIYSWNHEIVVPGYFMLNEMPNDEIKLDRDYTHVLELKTPAQKTQTPWFTNMTITTSGSTTTSYYDLGITTTSTGTTYSTGRW